MEKVAEEYRLHIPAYELLGRRVVETLEPRLRQSAIASVCSSRVKETSSLIKKMIKKRYSSLDEVTDRVGVRVIVTEVMDIPRVCEIVQESLIVLRQEDTSHRLEENQFGYLGTHFQLKLHPSSVREGEDEEVLQLECELQVRTQAQNVWNDASHKFLYKPDIAPPLATRRRLYRLMALMEIFDDECSATKEEIRQLPGSENWRVLRRLENHFYPLAGYEFDEQLTLEVIDNLMPIIGEVSNDEGEELIDKFVELNIEKLKEIFHDYKSAFGDDVLANQPEAILVWALIEKNRYRLYDAWVSRFSPGTLEKLAMIWGISIGETR